MGDPIISDAVPPGTVYFVAQREGIDVVMPDGSRKRQWLESEEEWARRCGIIINLKP